MNDYLQEKEYDLINMNNVLKIQVTSNKFADGAKCTIKSNEVQGTLSEGGTYG